MRTCPNCTKPIEDDAVKCPYCGKMTDYNDDNDEVKKLIVQMENKSPKKILSRIGNMILTFLCGIGVALKFIIMRPPAMCPANVCGKAKDAATQRFLSAIWAVP